MITGGIIIEKYIGEKLHKRKNLPGFKVNIFLNSVKLRHRNLPDQIFFIEKLYDL